MAIIPVQNNINTKLNPSISDKKVVKPYLDAEGAINTENNVHPLPPQGHLIHDTLGNSVKYFFKDIAYDMKSLKNGIKGTANDHQSGRLNDVGLVTAGLLIATYLASKTTDPKARLMEYVGLGAFLTAMSVYPKIAINEPSKLLHGYDIDKQFIDDQGRKKSVMQDANYVPYDMYLGEIPEEDIPLIGDKMGIPRGIKNRNDLIREQMRKNANQSNTLWMLTAAVTPALAALICCGIENYVAAPAIEKAGIAKYSRVVADMLEKTSKMELDVATIKSNQLSGRVESLLSSYKGQELPKEEFDNLIKLLTDDLFANTAEGVKSDVSKILGSSAAQGSESVVITEELFDKMIASAENSISKSNKAKLQESFVPTKAELESLMKRFIPENADLTKGVNTNSENLTKIREALKELIESKSKNLEGIPQEFLNTQKNEVVTNIINTLKAEKSSYVSEDSLKKIVDLAKVLGEFKENKRALENCSKFNIEHVSGSIIARSYGKFEKTLLDQLGINYSDLKKMRESKEYTKELLDKKFAEVAKDEVRFQKTMEKLGKVVSDMEVKLNGSDASKSRLQELINAIENNYNNTAKRLSKIGSFDSTINRLVKEDVETLSNSVNSRKELFDYLDGIVENKFKDVKEYCNLTPEEQANYLKSHSKGVGSSKNLEVSRIVERYQGAKNSFNRILHTFDVYKRALTPENFATNLQGKDKEYLESILKSAKEALLNASAPEHTMKLGTVNNPNYYKDLMNSVWASEAGEAYSTTQKGLVTQATKDALAKHGGAEKGSVLERFQYYISRFRNLVGNNTIDFTKPHHTLNSEITSYYTQAERTRMSIFNLIGQTPVDMASGAAGRRFATQKWVRIIGGITGFVFGIALLSQLGFGKLSNPQNVKRQVNNDTNK